MEPDKNFPPAASPDEAKPAINPVTPGPAVPQAPTVGSAAPEAPAMTPGGTVSPSVPPAAPSAPATYASAPAGAPVLPPKPRKKGLVTALIVAAGVLVLAGGSAAAYFGYYVPNKPENVLKAALVNSFDEKKMKTVHFEGEANVKDGASDMTLGADMVGAVGADCNFDLHFDIDALVTKLSVDMRSVDGKDFYVKVGGLEGLPELISSFGGSAPGTSGAEMADAYAPIIAGLNNQWLMINESLVKQAAGEAASCVHFSDADLQKVGDAYSKNQFLSVQKTLADEKIKDADSHHYKVAVDKAKLKGFFTAIKNADIKDVKLTDAEIQELAKQLENVDFAKYPIDVWVSKETKLINQLAFSYTEDKTTFDLRLTVTGVNKEVKVEKPADAKSIMEILGSLFGQGGLEGLTGGTAPGLGGSLEGSTDMDTMMRELQSGVSL